MSTFELSSQQVPEPSFQQRDNPSQEKQPHSPGRLPETASRTFAYRASVESVINDMFDVFALSDLFHELVLVTVHPGEVTDMVK